MPTRWTPVALLQLKIEHMGEIITAADRERVTKDRKKMAARVDLA